MTIIVIIIILLYLQELLILWWDNRSNNANVAINRMVSDRSKSIYKRCKCFPLNNGKHLFLHLQIQIKYIVISSC
jgi:hypothetical protein